MADIFISYSSKDREKADQLSELLGSAGFSVWIARQGIAGAEKWATEIVEGIKACSTFILLLSSSSIESENVCLSYPWPQKNENAFCLSI